MSTHEWDLRTAPAVGAIVATLAMLVCMVLGI